MKFTESDSCWKSIAIPKGMKKEAPKSTEFIENDELQKALEDSELEAALFESMKNGGRS
jgi:hypothetical protein